MRAFKKSEYVLSGLLAFIAAFPVATSSNGWALQVLPLAALSDNGDAMTVREDAMAARRQNENIRQICSHRAGRMEDDDSFVCPDPNNPDEIMRFMKGKPVRVINETVKVLEVEAEDEDATATPEDAAISKDDLSDVQESMLRRFMRNGTCPDGLNDILPGFQELCILQVKLQPAGERGFLNDRAKFQYDREQAAGHSLSDIIKMFKGIRPTR